MKRLYSRAETLIPRECARQRPAAPGPPRDDRGAALGAARIAHPRDRRRGESGNRSTGSTSGTPASRRRPIGSGFPRGRRLITPLPIATTHANTPPPNLLSLAATT